MLQKVYERWAAGHRLVVRCRTSQISSEKLHGLCAAAPPSRSRGRPNRPTAMPTPHGPDPAGIQSYSEKPQKDKSMCHYGNIRRILVAHAATAAHRGPSVHRSVRVFTRNTRAPTSDVEPRPLLDSLLSSGRCVGHKIRGRVSLLSVLHVSSGQLAAQHVHRRRVAAPTRSSAARASE